MYVAYGNDLPVLAKAITHVSLHALNLKLVKFYLKGTVEFGASRRKIKSWTIGLVGFASEMVQVSYASRTSQCIKKSFKSGSCLQVNKEVNHLFGIVYDM